MFDLETVIASERSERGNPCKIASVVLIFRKDMKIEEGVVLEMDILDKIAVVVSVILPLFNIPLIVRVIKRKSSEDISMWWAMGVWVCILLMAPSGFRSDDVVWRTFTHVNVLFFSAVAITVLIYRKKK